MMLAGDHLCFTGFIDDTLNSQVKCTTGMERLLSYMRIISAAEIIGGRAFLVHAKDDNAKSFYEHFGFEPSPIDPFHLYLLLKDIKKTLEI